jgi:DNA helicase-2/ATP-dependent DNA helicase PcrA
MEVVLTSSKKIVAGLIKARAEHLEGANISLKDRAVLSDISKAKSRGESADAMAIRAMNEPNASTSTTAVIAEVSHSLFAPYRC